MKHWWNVVRSGFVRKWRPLNFLLLKKKIKKKAYDKIKFRRVCSYFKECLILFLAQWGRNIKVSVKLRLKPGRDFCCSCVDRLSNREAIAAKRYDFWARVVQIRLMISEHYNARNQLCLSYLIISVTLIRCLFCSEQWV